MDEIDILVNEGNIEHSPPHRPAFWGMLRDDIYMAWPGTVEELLKFMDLLKFTDLVFTYVYAFGDVIHTKLYSTPSDTQDE